MSDPLKLPSFRHLRVVEAVARWNNLSRAAAEVHMSQPAVTQVVMKIEAWAGFRIFIRNQTGTFLTDEGRHFLACIRRLFTQIESALQDDILRAATPEVVRTSVSRLKSSHIKVLATVADSASFEDAALVLDLSRTAVHRTARGLELILGTELYERTPHGLVANQAARNLATGLQRACQVLREGLDEIALARGKGSSRIFIGAQPLASISLLADAINSVLAIHPDAQVRLIEGSYQFLLQELRSGRLDVMFGALKRPQGMQDVTEEPLFEEPYCVVARRGHPLSRKTSVTIRDLTTVDWVLPGTGQRRRAFERLFNKEAQRPTSCIDATTVSAQMAILTSSDRVTLLTPLELASEPRLNGLMALPIEIRIARSADGLTVRSDWRPSPFQSCFLDRLRERVRKAGLSLSPAGSPRAEPLPLRHAS
jgi:DNA-binding transcriptional LysR family regulator